MADNEILKAKINDYEWNKVKISSAATRPNQKSSYGSGISAQGTKEIFNAPSELIKERHNKLVEGLAYIGEEERARQSAESARQSAETARDVAENGQYNDDGTLLSAGRAQNEEQRERNENGYTDENDNFVNGRTQNETIRQSNEETRQAAETERQKGYTEMKSLIGDIDSAVDAILAIQLKLIGGAS